MKAWVGFLALLHVFLCLNAIAFSFFCLSVLIQGLAWWIAFFFVSIPALLIAIGIHIAGFLILRGFQRKLETICLKNCIRLTWLYGIQAFWVCSFLLALGVPQLRTVFLFPYSMEESSFDVYLKVVDQEGLPVIGYCPKVQLTKENMFLYATGSYPVVPVHCTPTDREGLTHITTRGTRGRFLGIEHNPPSQAPTRLTSSPLYYPYRRIGIDRTYKEKKLGTREHPLLLSLFRLRESCVSLAFAEASGKYWSDQYGVSLDISEGDFAFSPVPTADFFFRFIPLQPPAGNQQPIEALEVQASTGCGILATQDVLPEAPGEGYQNTCRLVPSTVSPYNEDIRNLYFFTDDGQVHGFLRIRLERILDRRGFRFTRDIGLSYGANPTGSRNILGCGTIELPFQLPWRTPPIQEGPAPLETEKRGIRVYDILEYLNLYFTPEGKEIVAETSGPRQNLVITVSVTNTSMCTSWDGWLTPILPRGWTLYTLFQDAHDEEYLSGRQIFLIQSSDPAVALCYLDAKAGVETNHGETLARRIRAWHETYGMRLLGIGRSLYVEIPAKLNPEQRMTLFGEVSEAYPRTRIMADQTPQRLIELSKTRFCHRFLINP